MNNHRFKVQGLASLVFTSFINRCGFSIFWTVIWLFEEVKKVLIILFLTVVSYANAQQFRFENYSVNSGLPQSQVYCQFQDSDGFLWLGTMGGGVAKFDGRNFTNFTVLNLNYKFELCHTNSQSSLSLTSQNAEVVTGFASAIHLIHTQHTRHTNMQHAQHTQHS